MNRKHEVGEEVDDEGWPPPPRDCVGLALDELDDGAGAAGALPLSLADGDADADALVLSSPDVGRTTCITVFAALADWDALALPPLPAPAWPADCGEGWPPDDPAMAIAISAPPMNSTGNANTPTRTALRRRLRRSSASSYSSNSSLSAYSSSCSRR